MKSLLFFVLLCFAQLMFVQPTFAHNLSESGIPKRWTIRTANVVKNIDGFFYFYKNGNVFIEKKDHSIASVPLAALTADDRAFVLNKNKKIEQLNTKIETANAAVQDTGLSAAGLRTLFLQRLLLLFALFGIIQGMKVIFKPKNLHFAYLCFGFVSLGFMYSFTTKSLTNTDPLTVDAAFTPFKPNVYTRWDATYFYVESKGIPTTHTMMQGITNWQQQFPLPQCYVGTNAWSIPLNPVLAAVPVPVNASHFSRGAVALAANGVAIFNPYTNTGVDAFLDGQLDTYGGHCGRADDYHYHTAPLHLYGTTSANLPIAYALDGFAVYGATEPEGGAMTALDANHGHTGANGVYHYHGTAAAPYMIGKMVGQVTEDATLQIIPQAAAQPLRPAGAPLQGAVITSCLPNATNNGYTLIYTKAGVTYSVEYSWTAAGVFTFNFISPTVTTTSTYNGRAICTVPVATTSSFFIEKQITIFPNPVSDVFYIYLNDANLEKSIKNTTIYGINGSKIIEYQGFKDAIDAKEFASGIYFIKIETETGIITKKIIIN